MSRRGYSGHDDRRYFNCDWKALKAEFSDAGTVLRADVEDGVGTVTYAEAADAAWAIKNWYFYNQKAQLCDL
eukprot:gene12026-7343_t